MKGHGTKIIKLVSTSGNTVTKSVTEGRIGRVCYVDDSRTSAYVTKKILKEYGYEVDFFPSAEPAVVAILENNYDLLLTDLTLSSSGMDGDELVSFLRNSGHPRKKLLPVIVITGTSDKETLLKIYEAGANGVLVKPITGEELHDRIRTLVPDKAYPGTADGYALEIPNPLEQPDEQPDGSQQKSAASPKISRAKASISKTLSATLSATTPIENKLDFPGVRDQLDETNDSTLTQIDTPSDKSVPKDQQKKTSKSTKAKQQQSNQQPLSNGVSSNTVPKKLLANKQKKKKLSILENLKLAAVKQESDLGLNQVTNIIAVGIEPEKKIPIKTSKQYTQPTYKSATNKNRKKVNAKGNAKNQPQSQHDDIPVLKPTSAKGDERLFSIDHKGGGVPELKLQDKPATVLPSKKRAKPKKPQQPAAEVDSSFDEDITVDKKIITALDINTDFSEFGDGDDIFRPSFMQSIFDVFHRFKILGLAALVSIGIIVWSLWSYISEKEVVSVDIARVSKGTLHQTINVPGRVVSKLNVNVSSSSSGQIIEVKVIEGQKVKKGDTLVRLENEEAISDIKRAEGNLLSAKEETALANKTLKRMRRALTLGAISQQQMEEAEASLKSAQAKENVAKESRRTAQLSLDKLSVVAPFDGTVTAKFAQIGQWITPSDTIFTLTDLSQREIEVKVDSADSNSISVGQSVFMASDASPDKTWTESVRRIASTANRNDGTNTVSVFISLGHSSPTLRMGQQVDAEIRIFSRNNTTKLPISAVITRNGKSWVGTIRNGRVHFVSIDTGMEDLTHVEVLSGVSPMQKIIIPEGGDLQEGDRVRISKSHASE